MHTTLVAGVGALALAGAALAQPTSDHLTCYKVRDSALKAKYSLTLTNAAVSLDCRIKVPAKLACIESAKSAVSPVPPGGGPTGVAGNFLCYALKCGRGGASNALMQDQFGRRTVTFRGTQLLCAPATRSSVTSGPAPAPGSTTTTQPGPTGQCRFADGKCQGTCGAGMKCGAAVGSASCECRATSCTDAAQPQCNGACPNPGDTCVFTVTGCSCVGTP